MLDVKELERLRARAPDTTPLLAVESEDIDPASLKDLADLLAVARRRYPLAPESEARDLRLVDETLALAYEAQADLRQLRADDRFRRALAQWRKEPVDEPRRLMAEVRLEYALRNVAAAWELAASKPIDPAAVGKDELVGHLEVRLALAQLRRDTAAIAHLRQEILRLKGKAPEAPRVLVRFASLPLGSRAQLAATARTLVALLRHYRLSPRQATLCAFFAATCAVDLGEYAFAEELLAARQEAFRSAPRLSRDAWFEAAFLSRLGVVRDELGDYEGALRALERAAARASALPDTTAFQARLELNMARTLLGLGKFSEARLRARSVIVNQDLPADLRLRARLLVGSAIFERARREPELLAEARKAFEVAAGELRGATSEELSGGEELEILIGVHLANTLFLEARGATDARLRASKLEEAAKRQYAAFEKARRGGRRRLASLSAANLGELYLELGALEKARQAVAWAREAAAELRQFETSWRCHWYLGRIAEREGDPATADEEFARAASMVEAYRARILDAEAKSGFMSNKMDLYRDMVELAVKRGRPAVALEVAERARARALVESLGWRFVSLANPQDTALYRELVTLLGSEARQRVAAPGSWFGVRAAKVDYEGLRRRLGELRHRLETSPKLRPALRGLVSGSPASSAEIVRDLGGGDKTLVEYFSLRRSMVAFVVDRGRVSAQPLAVSHAALRDKVVKFVAGGAADEDLARELWRLLIEPLAPMMSGRKLVIVPYGELHRLPFEALRDGDGHLVESLEIGYLPSASLLQYLRWNAQLASHDAAGSGEGLKLLALADPDTDYNRDGRRDMVALKYARVEVDGLSGSFPRPEVLKDKAALERSLHAGAPRADVIHLACHGEFYPSRPWDSTLFLAPGATGAADDGRLRAYEIYSLDLRGNRLVTLSGCETGSNEVSAGDDPAGLATAFLHSGAGSLLVSLWKVEDAATAELMRTFYRKWIVDGKGRSAALREAKLALARGKYRHPRQWAAFVMVGI